MAPIKSTEFIHKSSYIQVPRSIWNSDLSLEAVCLYAYLLDLSKLSEKNGNCDDDGIYVFCTLDTASQQLRCGKKKAIRIFKELLEKQLLTRKRRGKNLANVYYVSPPPEEHRKPAESAPAPDTAPDTTLAPAPVFSPPLSLIQQAEKVIGKCQNDTSLSMGGIKIDLSELSNRHLRNYQNDNREVSKRHPNNNNYNNNKQNNNDFNNAVADCECDFEFLKSLQPLPRLFRRIQIDQRLRASMNEVEVDNSLLYQAVERLVEKIDDL